MIWKSETGILLSVFKKNMPDFVLRSNTLQKSNKDQTRAWRGSFHQNKILVLITKGFIVGQRAIKGAWMCLWENTLGCLEIDNQQMVVSACWWSVFDLFSCFVSSCGPFFIFLIPTKTTQQRRTACSNTFSFEQITKRKIYKKYSFSLPYFQPVYILMVKIFPEGKHEKISIARNEMFQTCCLLLRINRSHFWTPCTSGCLGLLKSILKPDAVWSRRKMNIESLSLRVSPKYSSLEVLARSLWGIRNQLEWKDFEINKLWLTGRRVHTENTWDQGTWLTLHTFVAVCTS